MKRWDYSVQLVTDEKLAFPELCHVVECAVSGGVGIVQLRGKSLSAKEMVRQSLVLSRITAGRAALIVNDRVDVAMAARHSGAAIAGVHLGQDDISPAAARHLLGPDSLIGWTADQPRHIRSIEHMPPGTIDYLGVGVIRSTARKKDHPSMMGIEGFGEFAQQTSLPCVAIGGILPADVSEIRRSGGAGVAVIAAICDAAEPFAATRQIIEASR